MPFATHAAPLAFPGAEGFGAIAIGGRHGRVLRVTNLNADGPGSLQAACAADGPRIVVFAVAGVLRGDVFIKHSRITIAGQTAPAPGITLAGRLIARPDTPQRLTDIVVRHLRLRPPPIGGHEGDVIQIPNSERVMLDHLSLAWGSDEMIDIIQSADVTVQWSTIEESDPAGHAKGMAHNYGLLSAYPGSGNVSILRNLFAHHARRLPSVSPAEAGRPADFRNNVVYNFRDGLSDEGHVPHAPVNLVGNYYKRGPSARRINPFHFHPQGSYYVADNYLDGAGMLSDVRPGARGLPAWVRVTGGGTFLAQPAPVPYTTTTTAAQAYAAVLQRAGAFPRDQVTRRTVAEVQSGTGAWRRQGPPAPTNDWFLDGLPRASAPTDSDSDGMPDAWERRHGLDARDPRDANRVLRGGYTAIESYLNERAAEVEARGH